ncbi:MAG: glutamine synthetase [Chloroflexi bacterium]|nr:glutamine synthetase [Chloroflexota bacterium]
MVRDGRVETLIVAFTDMQGRLMGKRVQGDAFLRGVIDHGAHFCTYLLGTDMEMNTPDGFRLMNWETGYGDWVAAPVWSTMRVLPWLDKTALVLSDTIDEGSHEEIPVSPRTILKRQVGRATEMGFTVKAGSEFEYYLLTDTYEEAHRKGFVDLERFGWYNEDYHLLQGTKAEPIHGKLRNLMTQARIPIEFSKGEAAPGQHEVNIRYDDVLESADRSVIFKHGAKEIAWLNGFGLTFMAKPDHGWTGSSGHLHMSLWDRGGSKPLFHDRRGEPYGMSQAMKWFLGGMMALSRELAVFLAPNINSYKRFAVASWAPVNVVWGRDNRTTGFRVVGHGEGLHIEDRFPGGDMNAYLTYAAMVGAGLWGIQNKVEALAEYKGNGYLATGCDRMPRALYEAISELERSEAAVTIFGQDVVDHYLNAARVEQQAYDAVVHPWERERYLERG